MHDNVLIAAALCVAALGMTGLLFAVVFFELPLSSIQDANTAEEGTVLQVRAMAKGVQHRGNMTVLTISQPATIDVIVFSDVSVQEDSCIIVQGKKSDFNGKPQITATRIKLC